MEELKEKILNLGATLAGFADLRGCLPAELNEYSSGISIAIKLDDKIIDKIRDGPTIEYCNHYQEINKRLNFIAGETKKHLEKNGFKAIAVDASERLNDTEIRGLFPHKTAATRAGLGWIGKSALLVTKEYGPRVRLITVLTNALLEYGTPINESYCGNCTVCVQYCPVKAVKGVNWNINSKREDILDVYICEKENSRHKQRLRHKLCGICVSVCPRGKKI